LSRGIPEEFRKKAESFLGSPHGGLRDKNVLGSEGCGHSWSANGTIDDGRRGDEWKSYPSIILATHIALGQTSRTTSNFGSGSILLVFATLFKDLDGSE
jgi:hypothetical protein